MMIVILLALVLTAANSDTVRTSVSTGTPLIVNQVHQSGELYESQSFWFRFEDVPFEFSSEVFERDNPLETGVHEDYESNLARHTETYKPTDICSVKRTGIEFSKIAETATFAEPVQAYLFDEDYGIYLLSGRWLSFHVVGTVDNSIQLKKYAEATLSTDFVFEDASFVHIEGAVYLSDGKVLLRIRVDDQSRTIHNNVVAGFEPLTQQSRLVKLVQGLTKKELYVLGGSTLNTYEFVDLDTVKKTNLLPADYRTNGNTFMDIVVNDQCICVLDFLQGLIIINGTTPATITNFELTYGSAEKLEVVGDTLEIIFRYHRTYFVGEFFMRDGTLELNRFYDHVAGFKDIDFHNQKGLFIGEDEILIIDHSVNRNFLLGIDKQHARSFSAYGMVNFEVMPKHSDKNTIMMVGIATYGAIIVKMEQQKPELKCNFKGVSTGGHTFMVEFNTSTCGSFNWLQFHHQYSQQDRYCRIRIPFHLNVKRAYERKVSNLFSTALFLVVVIGIMLLIGAAAKWKFNMNSLIVRLRNELRRKQNNKGSSVNALRS